MLIRESTQALEKHWGPEQLQRWLNHCQAREKIEAIRNEDRKLDLYTVDVYDLFVGKLFSKRTKDLDDLRAIKPKLEKSILEQRMRESTGSLAKDPALKDSAQKNWYILFGEDLPS